MRIADSSPCDLIRFKQFAATEWDDDNNNNKHFIIEVYFFYSDTINTV